MGAAPHPAIDDPQFHAGLDMLQRLGVTSVQLRYQDDQEPIVWMMLACFKIEGHDVWQVAAALDPPLALIRLLEQLMDGGRCAHCQKPTGLVDGPDEMPAGELVCWYQYDPELKTYRRGCE